MPVDRKPVAAQLARPARRANRMNPEDDDRTVIRPRSARTDVPASPPAEASAATEQPTLVQTTPPAPTTTTPTTEPTIPPTTGASTVNVQTSHAITLPAGTRLGEFEVTSTIGEGGFGIVYLAWDHSLDRKVALKEYMPSSIAFRAGQSEIRVRSERHQETFDAGMKSFINEAKLLAQFDHPSLLKVYRFWEANHTAYMVMPFLEGATVRDTVRAMPGPPDEAWIVGLLQPVCDALAMLHAVQVYHRDIAPDNILLLAETGRPLLLDFGAARRVIGDMTQALTAILKPGYAPVEQYADMPGLKQGPWTDVYALAAVAHWMIIGKTPSPSVGRLFDDAYVPLAQSAAGRYSDAFLQAIDRGLAVMPDKRTQSVEAFRADLVGAPAPVPPASTTAAPTVMTRTMAVPQTQTRVAATTRPPVTTTTEPAVAVPLAPSTTSFRNRLLLAAGTFVVVAAIVAAMLWPRSTSTPTTTPTATAPAQTLPAATTPAAIEPQPAAAASATPATELPAQTALPPPVVSTTPASTALPPKAARPRPEPRTEPRERRPEATPRVAEPKAVEPRNAETPAAAGNRDECARLFQRLSIGDTDQSLIDRIRALRCR